MNLHSLKMSDSHSSPSLFVQSLSFPPTTIPHYSHSSFPATGHRPPATTTGHRPPATRPPGHQPPATGHRPPATGHRPPATGHQPPATGHRPPATGTGHRHWPQTGTTVTQPTWIGTGFGSSLTSHRPPGHPATGHTAADHGYATNNLGQAEAHHSPGAPPPTDRIG